jgi:hypothetical protein
MRGNFHEHRGDTGKTDDADDNDCVTREIAAFERPMTTTPKWVRQIHNHAFNDVCHYTLPNPTNIYGHK